MYVVLILSLVISGAFGTLHQTTKVPSDCECSKTTSKPVKCGYNEHYVKCKTKCPPQSCDISYTDYSCDSSSKICEPGCDCIKDHLRNSSNICIPNDQCPPPPTSKPVKCGYNEHYVKCKTKCPPQSCDISYTDYLCDSSSKICEPGCDCIKDHLRNSSNICILNDQCPPPPTASPDTCGPNEVSSDCKIVCPPQSCESIYTTYLCYKGECETGCNCRDGYLRDANNTCIPSEQCPPGPLLTRPKCGPNEIATKCKIQCPPQSCESVYSSYNCENQTCEAGCDCKDGYLRDSNNICIPSDKCPPAPSTQCGVNETYVDCAFRCPNQNCPEDDSLIQVACKPGRPCPAGCACKDGYRRKSSSDDTCILASDCPPVSCTRPNEEWDSCSSDCLVERCEDADNQQSGCEAPAGDCRPRCVCKKNFCRDNDDICIPSKASTNPVCEPTCAEPNPSNCQSRLKKSGKSAGTCQDGYILSEKGGKCIKIEDCPKGCNGDPHAIAKVCPAACPSTCGKPNALPCSKQCEPLGCQCDFGYLRSEKNGKCILPDQCPGGNPCRSNETFVACKSGCPTDYCPTSDSRAILICEPFPFALCFSGCICKLNHKRLSSKDDRCIVSSECPPVNCTRPDEEWNPCPSECQGENCDSANQGTVTCNTLVLNCQPRCTCKKNYFRNADDICIPASECPQS